VSSNTQVDRTRAALRGENYLAAQKWAEDIKTSTFSKELGSLEAGRVHQLAGEFEESVSDFDMAIETVMKKTETGPVVNLEDVAWNVGSALVDERMRKYRIPPYEFIQALNYQMWNYIFLGDPEAARVEARRAVLAQDAIAEKYGPKVDAGSSQVSEGKYSGAMNIVESRMAPMAPVLEKTRSSYENSLAWYFCGILFELDDDASNARLSYQKAWELSPGNPYLERDMLRLARSESPDTFDDLMSRSRLPPESLARSSTEIVLVAEENFIAQRYSVKIPLPLGTITSVDFPMYFAPFYQPVPLQLSAGEQALGPLTPTLFLQSLAYQDLKEKMPGVVVRNVIRAGSRIAAQQVANASNNEYAMIGVCLFNLIMTAVNEADTRAWYTLPMVTHVYRGNVEPGVHHLTLMNQASGQTVSFPVSVAEGETRFIWVGDLAGRSRVVTASMNGKGDRTTYTGIESLLVQ